MIKNKKIWIGILVVVILIVGGCVEDLENPTTTTTSIVTPPESGNHISISDYQENGKNILLFDITLEDYSVESINQTYFGVSYEELGSKVITPPKFDHTTQFPFVEIKTDSDCLDCGPMTPYLMIEMELPLGSDTTAELFEFNEEKIEKKLDIAPCILCEYRGFCSDCSNYLKEDEFYPDNVSIYTDISTLDVKKLRVYLPLFRHKPSTRETYMIKKAKIRVGYELIGGNLLLIEEDRIPSKVDTSKFEVSFKVMNPSTEEFKNLRIKVDLDGGVIINLSKEFDIGSFESQVISLEVQSLWYPGSHPFNSYIVKDSELIAIGPSEWLHFSQKEVELKPKLTQLTSKDFYGVIRDGWWVVYFWDERVKQCWQITPTIEEVSKDLKEINFGEFDTSQEYSWQNMGYYNISIIPTLILLKDAEEIDRKVGSKYSKEELKDWLESHIKEE